MALILNGDVPLVRPETLQAYDSAAGTALILCGVGVTLVAYRLMIGLGRLPEERRWFT